MTSQDHQREQDSILGNSEIIVSHFWSLACLMHFVGTGNRAPSVTAGIASGWGTINRGGMVVLFD